MSASRPIGSALMACCLTLVAVACGDDADSSSVAAGCKPKHADVQTINDGKLTVAAFNALPMFQQKPGQPLAGIDGELLAQLAKTECLELEVQITQASSAIPAVQARRADVAAGGWYRTDERGKIVEFTPPYYADTAVFVSKEGYDTIDSLNGKTVGTVQGYLWVKPLEEIYGKDNVRTYQTPEAQFSDLANGRIDAVIEGLAVASEAARQRPDAGLMVKPIQPDPQLKETKHPGVIALPLTKGNTSLRSALGEDVNRLLEQGKIDEYLKNAGVDPAAAKLPAGEE